MPRKGDQLLEESIESYFYQVARQYGCKAKKIPAAYPGWYGWPDRIVFWPVGISDFAELKRPKGGRFEVGQERKHDDMRAMGFEVVVLYTKAAVDKWFYERAAKLGVKRKLAAPPKRSAKALNVYDFLERQNSDE